MRKFASIMMATALLFASVAAARDSGTAHHAFASFGAERGAGAAPDGSLTGGTLRLDPLLPGGGGASASTQLLLFGSVGQPTVTLSSGTRFDLRAGFWTPVDVAADRIFYDGFE